MSFDCNDGSDLVLDLPIESLNSLIMTLPAMMTSVLRRQDETPGLVYPTAVFDIDRDVQDPGGFTASFGVTRQRVDVFVSAANELDRRRASARIDIFH